MYSDIQWLVWYLERSLEYCVIRDGKNIKGYTSR